VHNADMSAKQTTGRFGLATGKGTVSKDSGGRYVIMSSFRRFTYVNSKALFLVAKKKASKKEPVFDAATAVEMLDNPQAPNAALLSLLAED
jgi:hypothetical protein